MALTYKVWRSFTEPLHYKGMNLEYFLILLLMTGVVYTVTFRSFLISIPFLIIGLMLGVMMTRRDKRWFSVVVTGLRYFSGKIFSRRKYVR